MAEPDNRTHLLELIMRFMVATNQIDGIYYLISKKIGISENELAVLYAIADGKPHSQNEVSCQWLIPKTTINTIIHKYKEEGLITLNGIDGKRREMNITLTPKGQNYCRKILEPIYACETYAMKQTLEKYSEAFVEGVEKFSRTLEDTFAANILTENNKGL